MKRILNSLVLVASFLMLSNHAISQAPDDSFKLCADEGKRCFYTGTGRVAYGANGKFTYANVSRGLACTTAAFGGFDPVPNKPKKCYVRLDDPNGIITSQPRPDPPPTPKPVVNVRPPVVPTQTSNTSSGTKPVVMPASNSTLRSVGFSLSRTPIDQAYIRPQQESNLDAGHGSPAASSPIRSEYYDFALNTQGELFYANSSSGFYGFGSGRGIERLNYSSPSKLVKIAGTDRSRYRQDGKLRYNTNLYALTEDGRVVTASFDSSSNPPNQISFSVVESDDRFSDIHCFDEGTRKNERLLALTTDSRLLVYSKSPLSNSTGTWTELAKTNFVKFVADDFNGTIHGLTANNELWIGDTNGKGWVKTMDNVKDFSVFRGSLYYISSKTNLLMTSDRKKVDEKGTFVKFIANNVCLVKNGNGQVFVCR